ncbi:hypothetical protein [Methanothermococcus okinawensis]|uniref:Uncharacterized protein n=1 Tax=Methanothermococcus okinawensis (strain DSM 14208 / JCM 11175 / IH1) TaxID=647113 RepID=F8AP24_METOI|nr:hypothetical protein [Methanothermococcus okinawensis]AEH07592.1 hypothetical protein Metok_1630 [Methanothermococcus okinawensis IH1]
MTTTIEMPTKNVKKEKLSKEDKWVLKMVQPILAKDWNSKEDEYWDDY